MTNFELLAGRQRYFPNKVDCGSLKPEMINEFKKTSGRFEGYNQNTPLRNFFREKNVDVV